MAYYTRLSHSGKILDAVENLWAEVLYHTRYEEDIRRCESLLNNFVWENGFLPAIDSVSTYGLALIGRMKYMVKIQ